MAKSTDWVGSNLVIIVLNSLSSSVPKLFSVDHKSIFMLQLASHVFKHAGFVGNLSVRSSSVQKFLVWSWVQKEINSSQENLTESLGGSVFIFSINFHCDQIIRKRLTSFVVLWHFLEDVFVPNPIFKHLRWHLYEIFFNRSSRELVVISLRAHVMHDMTKLMEECNNLSVV